MKKKKILSAILVTIFLIAGISTIVLYKLGDRVFNEVIDMQISEIEKTLETAPQAPPQSTNTSEVQPAATTQIPATKPTGSKDAPTAKPAAADQGIQLTTDKLEDIKASVTPSDKMAAAALVLGKLNQSDIKHLTELSAGGITPEEKDEMKELVYSRFTQEEIEKIKEMYIKYMK